MCETCTYLVVIELEGKRKIKFMGFAFDDDIFCFDDGGLVLVCCGGSGCGLMEVQKPRACRRQSIFKTFIIFFFIEMSYLFVVRLEFSVVPVP